MVSEARYVASRNPCMASSMLLIVGLQNYSKLYSEVVLAILLWLLSLTYQASGIFLCVFVYVGNLIITGTDPIFIILNNTKASVSIWKT